MRPKLWMLGQFLEEGATAVQGSLDQGLNSIEVTQPEVAQEKVLWIEEERMVEPALEPRSSNQGTTCNVLGEGHLQQMRTSVHHPQGHLPGREPASNMLATIGVVAVTMKQGHQELPICQGCELRDSPGH